jgi:VWFA-related protein
MLPSATSAYRSRVARLLATALVCCGAATSLCAQAIPPASPPPEALPADPADLVAPSHIPTIRVETRRVVVDIVVTDAKGKPVTGLKKGDFRIFEDSKPQEVRSFDAHVTEPQLPVPAPQLPPNTFSNFSSAPQSGPVTVILYDLLNTPLESQAFAHEQLLQFLKQRKTASQTAIFVLSDRLHMLQGFTDDENELIAALNTPHKQAYKSGLLQGPGESSQASDNYTRTEGNQNGAEATTDVSFAAIATMLKHMETIESSAMLDRRVEITADALEQIARFVIALPGRKNLLWLSGSFPTGILPDESLGDRDSFNVTRNYSETVMQATDLLNVSHVAVYPVDVRGLQANPMFSASSNQTFEPGRGKDLSAVKNFSQQNNAEHTTMDTMADQTGGHAFYNTNGLKEAVAAAVEDGSAYYTLTYSPSNTKLDGGQRHVRVELAQPGYKLAYRRTYFADNVDQLAQAAADNPAGNALDPLVLTLEHGAPAARQLFFAAHVQTYGESTPATPEQLDVLDRYEARLQPAKNGKPAKPVARRDGPPVMMQRYVITYGLLLRQLTLSVDDEGTHRGNLEFAVISYNDDGLALNGIRSKIADVIPLERYTHMQSSGYEAVQSVAVPVQAASLRIAVRDTASNYLGSTEVRLPLRPEAKP